MPEKGDLMSFDFELERGERRCGFCQNWVMKSRSYGECIHWHEVMVAAGLNSADIKGPTTYEDGRCSNFEPDYGQIQDYRDADYTRPGAIWR